MKIRNETIALLRYIYEQEVPVSVTDVADKLDRRKESLRNQFKRYVEANLLKVEERYDKHRGAGRPVVQYFTTTLKARALLDRYCHIKACQPKIKPRVNSVFSLGESVYP